MVFVESQIETNSIYLCLITLLRRFFVLQLVFFFYLFRIFNKFLVSRLHRLYFAGNVDEYRT
jgi:hypothetical protein